MKLPHGLALVTLVAATLPALAADPAAVRVFGNSQLIPAQYAVVKRLWVESIPAMFWYPRFASESAALDAMRQAAADAGADGVIHAACSDVGQHGGGESRFLCHALAIKLK